MSLGNINRRIKKRKNKNLNKCRRWVYVMKWIEMRQNDVTGDLSQLLIQNISQ